MVAEVIVDISNSQVDKVFDYEILDCQVHPGSRVLVPFRNRNIEGFVIKIKETSDFGKLKSIIKVLDEFTPITSEMLELLNFMTEKYNLRKADVLRLFIPNELRGGKVRDIIKKYFSINTAYSKEEMLEALPKNAVKQIELVNYLFNVKGAFQTDINKKFGTSALNGLIKKNFVKTKEKHILRQPNFTTEKDKIVKLNKEQVNAVDTICENNGTILLYGVTGSGKTEVYLNAIEKQLKLNKTAIMLVPEIALTPQMFNVFYSRFQNKIAILHSGLSSGERFDEWKRLLNGDAKIAIGARSAIFAPLENVGIIVIDEEHDSSYVSESNPRYNTIEVAKFRAKYNNCPVVLGSATPSIKSYLYAKYNQYKLVELKHRANQKEMPKMEVVDMSKELRSGNNGVFSETLINELKSTLEKNNQAMIFINRRGYSSFVMCKQCGFVAKCEDCDVSLTYHKDENALKCHYCGKRYRMVDKCPVCGSEYIKHGKIGTETVENEIKKLFGDVSVLRMDNDTTSTKDSYNKILTNFRNQKAQVLVGTQMIAKGHDFPNVTLVGILDADFSLYFSDYRSSERTFQLITQVAGRAGRGEKSGKVILQTYSPRHYVFNYATNYDYEGFFEKENNSRRVTQFPPYTTIIRIMVTSLSEENATKLTQSIFLDIKKVKEKYSDRVIYCQAMKSPIKRMQKKFRYQILLRLKKKNDQPIINEIYNIVNLYEEKNSWTFVEINPQSLV